MSGAAMQLHCYRGASSRAFACGSGSTLWRGTYQKVTPFALVDVVDSGNRAKLVGTSGTKKVTIGRNGDLLSNVYLEINLPTIATAVDAYVKNVGMAFIRNCQLKIGTQIIDEITGREMDIHDELFGSSDKSLRDLCLKVDHEEMQGLGSATHNEAAIAGAPTDLSKLVRSDGTKRLFDRSAVSLDASGTINLFVPLSFWFCQNPAAALPLVSLMYHEVSLSFEFRTGAANEDNFLSFKYDGVDAAIKGTTITGSTIACNVIYTYVLLSSEEREAMASSTFEQLLVQHQRQGKVNKAAGTSAQTHDIRLNFNHPVTCMMWLGRLIPNSVTANTCTQSDPFEARGHTAAAGKGVWKHTFSECQLKLNNQRRFGDAQKPTYFTHVQPYQHFNRVPKENYIYCYSFAQAPGNWCQPSGHLNFSRVDSANLVLKTMTTGHASDTLDIYVFALNLNILRYSGGLGGARYSV